MDNPAFVVNLPALSVTAGNPVTVYTPPPGATFTVWSIAVSLSAGGAAIVKSGNTELFRTPVRPSGNGIYIPLGPSTALPDVRGGVQALNPGDPIKIDVTATSTVQGFLLVSVS